MYSRWLLAGGASVNAEGELKVPTPTALHRIPLAEIYPALPLSDDPATGIPERAENGRSMHVHT